jgi:hypothetical protein
LRPTRKKQVCGGTEFTDIDGRGFGYNGNTPAYLSFSYRFNGERCLYKIITGLRFKVSGIRQL